MRIFDNLIKILNNKIDLLSKPNQTQDIVMLKNSIELYSQFQKILQISQCDYISFFSYDYSRRYISVYFIFSINEKGFIVQNSLLNELPVQAHPLTLNILKTDDLDLYSISTDEIRKENIEEITHIINYREVEKLYYQNIFKDDKNPFGFVVLSYKNNITLTEEQKNNILRIIEKIKLFL